MAEPNTCPACETPMVPGRLRVKGTLGGVLLAGISWQHLFWSDREETRASRQKLIGSGDRRPADRCPGCGLVAFWP